MGRLLDEDTVIKVLERWQKAFRENSHYVSASDLSLVVKDVRELPPAQPERQRGEWIEISSINHTYKCSECGRLLVNVVDGRNNVSKHYPYCHCGADMRGEQG